MTASWVANDPTRTSPGNFTVTHKTLPFDDVLECLLDLREDLRRRDFIAVVGNAAIELRLAAPRHGRHGRTATLCGRKTWPCARTSNSRPRTALSCAAGTICRRNELAGCLPLSWLTASPP